MSINETKHYNLLILVFSVQPYVIKQPPKKEDVEIMLVVCVNGAQVKSSPLGEGNVCIELRV